MSRWVDTAMALRRGELPVARFFRVAKIEAESTQIKQGESRGGNSWRGPYVKARVSAALRFWVEGDIDQRKPFLPDLQEKWRQRDCVSKEGMLGPPVVPFLTPFLVGRVRLLT